LIQEFASGLHLLAIGKALDEFDQHAIGVFDLEGVVAHLGFAGAGFDVVALGAQVGAHLLDVVDGEAEMAHHAWWMCRRLVEEFDVLMVVNLDEGDANVLSVWLVEGISDVVAEEVMPEDECLGQVGDEVADMGDAGNLGALRSLSVGREAQREGDENEVKRFYREQAKHEYLSEPTVIRRLGFRVQRRCCH